MTLNAASELQFSSPAGEANYRAARRRYPAQAIVDLATLRDNMAHLVDVVGGPHSGTAVMGVVKADAYGHGLLPAALAALAGGATWLGTAQSHEAEGIRYTLEVKCLRKDEQAIRALVFNALHQPGFIVQSIAASDLPDDLVVITTVVATHMSSNIDIESSIETVITTPEVLGVKWDAEQITAVD